MCCASTIDNNNSPRHIETTKVSTMNILLLLLLLFFLHDIHPTTSSSYSPRPIYPCKKDVHLKVPPNYYHPPSNNKAQLQQQKPPCHSVSALYVECLPHKTCKPQRSYDPIQRTTKYFNLIGNFRRLSPLLPGTTSLSIINNAYITSLASLPSEGFPPTTSNMVIPQLYITNCPSLQQLDFPNSYSRFQQLSLSNNNGLMNLCGMSSISTIDLLEISKNNNLISLEGATQLTSIGTLLLSENKNLKSLEGVTHLTSIGTLMIENHATLESLVGLERITSLSLLEIKDAPLLQNLTGLNNINNVLKWLTLYNLTALTSILALNSLQNVPNIEIAYCPSLRNLNGMPRNAVVSITLRNLVTLNDISALSEQSISLRFINLPSLENLHGLSKSTIDGIIHIEGCPLLVNLQGLRIQSQIQDLQFRLIGLLNLKSLLGATINVKGILFLVITDCPKLVSLNADEWNIPTRVYVLTLINLPSLVNIDAFMPIVFNSMNIQQCPLLEHVPPLRAGDAYQDLVLIDLNSLLRFSAGTSVRSLNTFTIQRCPKLTSLHGLGDLESVNGFMKLNGLSSLASLDGLNKLSSVLYMNISECPKLQTLEGLTSLKQINTLTLVALDSLTSLRGLEHVETIFGSITIDSNNNLESLLGFPSKVTHVTGKLEIINNTRLKSLVGLSNMTSCGTLSVVDPGGMDLITFDGLQNIRVISNELTIKLTRKSKLQTLGSVGSLALRGIPHVRLVGLETYSDVGVNEIRKFMYQVCDVGLKVVRKTPKGKNDVEVWRCG
jgi:hypothetical protein